ncbi:MAG: WbqC family protein [Microscillaceae bacterium]|jgi:hypothetical protein|nr:WbqC family protein [Microscillaceae bacterium]
MEDYGSQPPIVVEMQYLPSVQYFSLGWASEDIFLDIFENYQKQSYRNRTRIMTANGVYELVVPVKHASNKQIAKDVQIDYDQKWAMNHWRTIYSAYGKAPFFEYYADTFARLYQKKFPFLWDLNLEILTKCLKILGLPKNFQISTAYIEQAHFGEIRDFRSLIHPKKALLLPEASQYRVYQQVFGKTFEPNLSILDLIMCEGPNAKSFLISGF